MIDLQHVLMVLFSFTIAITLHEFGHAYTADLLGDDTPRRQGRISLNPLDHLDPIGTIVILLSSFFGGLFGWGRPVTVNVNNFKNPRVADTLVTIAGPFMNIFLACLCGLLLRSNAFHQSLDAPINDLLRISTELNVVLFLFNLIPIPPLDGSRLMANALPVEQAIAYARLMNQYGMILLLLLMFFGWPVIEVPFNNICNALLG